MKRSAYDHQDVGPKIKASNNANSSSKNYDIDVREFKLFCLCPRKWKFVEF